MATSNALARTDGEDNDLGLNARQIQALEKLSELGAAPRVPGEKTSSNPQIRAYQLIYEGTLGGPGRGQGRRRDPRAAEQLAEDIRKMAPRMKRVLKRAMKEEAGVKANLDAVKLAVDIERGERKLQIEEEDHDQLGDTREEILGALFELVGQPEVRAALREGARGEDAIDVSEDDIFTEAEVVEGENEGRTTPIEFEFVVEDNEDDEPARRSPAIGTNGRNGDSADPASARSNGRSSRRNGRKRVAYNRPEGPNPFTEIALRRAAER